MMQLSTNEADIKKTPIYHIKPDFFRPSYQFPAI